MNTELSILIPTYNRACTRLVASLQKQADRIGGFRYEVIVADDASTDEEVKRTNRTIGSLPHCRLLELPENVGRARIRNHLAAQAQYANLLFLDSDVLLVSDRFIEAYLACEGALVVYGGVTIPSMAGMSRSNLRYRYEVSCIPKFTVSNRNKAPYQGFRTTNFMVRREVMLSHPFNPRICRYGYEDVQFGKRLRAERIPILHIDNPVAVDDFEPNEAFMRKTEEGLSTLYSLRNEIKGYSQILDIADRLERYHLGGAVSQLFRAVRPLLRCHLLGKRPTVSGYHLYRLGYFLRMKHRRNK